MKISALVALAVSSCATARTITVYNGCPFTIWPATFTGVGATPDFATGWEADAYTSVSFSVPDNWQAGRIWARRDCNFDDPNPATQCLDGGCNGGLECDPTTGTGIPPATLAEFTLQGSGFVDYFDISMVDGYNLPMRIDNNQGCGVPDCAVDLGPNYDAYNFGYTDDACPNVYAYAYDDATATFTCDSNLAADYTVTFCPAS
ncbi:hypothetical protein EW026_g2219 [Hermanssonia centrifuga]|uniref:Thaumatin-like protein n=1 Tax=Hermanssonia centrifuga TaxID=98765 RepID=A0A4S4KQY8_9APHY|nr:hypothetical protein EW026_g2219 [Hermanssonia centrifuga]